jgi:hypothetical protein
MFWKQTLEKMKPQSRMNKAQSEDKQNTNNTGNRKKQQHGH